ncbi:MAG: hypothetical protein IPK03_08900 [Bacteroidetes bacterium]|nr:hypothetical protein [Bacteroidota bacterium]
MNSTDKIHLVHLANIAMKKGMKYVVISPGSRSAPLVIAFNRQEEIECLSIVDERSAAFFALGMAQQLQAPVGLLCPLAVQFSIMPLPLQKPIIKRFL